MAGNSAQFNLNINTTANLNGINQLKSALAEIKSMSLNSFGDASQMNQLLNTVSTLEIAMQKAFNPKLNTVNVTKFNSLLAQSGTNIMQIKADLDIAGATGQKAFLSMANSLMGMNNVTKQTNTFLNNFAKTVGNTVRYQAINMALQSITSSISEAYGYVKSLDTSLNNIQIVTEKNASAMRDFAKEANTAAKALGASTTDYTDASLIYYQQGLGDEEVKGRTDTTIKMANVLGESASEVSDYMTAIWNNFDDGTKSLEYYGDAIASLGAHTASSAAEIAEGLGKFASIAKTTGLSYEYATAALATVVAETRQSADTVGTAFKTLFARIQDLELGDEGTVSIGKYAQALEKVGINILDAKGNMKEMNFILDEMGSKWNTLSQAQQTALAQNVAGTRQYTQLVALMNNWDEVKKNVEIAGDATGTLNDKQEIYMESTKAHLQQMSTAWENVFDSLLDAKNINSFADTMTKVADGAATFADSIGGLIPLLASLGMTGMKVFNSQISGAIAGTISNFSVAISKEKEYQQNLIALQAMFGDVSWIQNGNNLGNTAQATALQQMMGTYEQISKYRSIMSEQDAQIYQNILNQTEALGQQNIDVANTVASLKEAQYLFNGIDMQKAFNLENMADSSGLSELDARLITLRDNFSGVAQQAENLQRVTTQTGKQIAYKEMISELDAFRKGLINAQIDVTKLDQKLKETGAIDIDNEGIFELSEASEISQKALENLVNRIRELINEGGQASSAVKGIATSTTLLNNSVEDFTKRMDMTYAISQGVQLASSLGQVAMSIQMVSNIGSIWKNDDLTTGEKLLQIITNIGFALPMLVSAFKSLNSIMGVSSSLQLLVTTGLTNNSLARAKNNAETLKGIALNEIELAQSQKNVALKALENKSLNDAQKAIFLNIIAEKEETITKNKEILARQKSILSIKEETAALNVAKVATLGLAAAAVIGIAAIIAVVNARDQESRNLIENNNAIIENCKKKKEEYEANREIFLSYQEVNEAYKNGKASLSELEDASDKLTDAYHIHNKALLTITHNYEGLAEAARKAREEELKLAQTNAQQEASAASASALEQYKLKSSFKNRLLPNAENVEDYILAPSFATQDFIREFTDNGKSSKISFSQSKGGLYLDDIKTANDLIEIYDTLISKKEYLQRMGYSEAVFVNIDAFLKSNQETVEQLKAANEELLQSKVNLAAATEDRDSGKQSLETFEGSYSDFESQIQKFKDKLNNIDELRNDSKKQDEAITKYLQDLNSSYGNTYLALNELKNKVDDETKQYIDKLTDGQKEYLISGKVNLDFVQNQEDIENEIQLSLNNALSNFEVDAGVNLANSLVAGKKLTKADNKNLQTLEGESPETMAGFDDKSTMHQLDAIDKLTNYKIAKNQEYLTNTKEFLNQELQVREAEQKHIFDSEKQYLDAKKELKSNPRLSHEEQEALKNQIEQYEKLERITTSLQDKMEEGLSWEEINQLGFEDVIGGMQMVIDKAQQTKNAMELIGDGFKVAADDVEKLSQMFPELLDQSQALSDGTLQLNSDVVKENINGIKQELEARSKAKLAEIDTQIELKELEKQYLQEKLNNLDQYLKGEQSGQETIDNINRAGQEYRSALIEITGQDISELENHAINSANNEGKALLDMLNHVGKGFAQAAQAHVAMINGEDFKWENVDWGGAAGGSAETFALSSGDKAKALYEEAKGTYEDIYAEYQTTIAQFNTTQGEIDTLKAQRAVAESSYNAALSSINNVESGKAGKDSKSKGGGGGNSKKEKIYEEEFDEFYEIKKSIEDVEDAMSDLEKQQKHLTGHELANSLREENALLEKQKQNYEKLLDAQHKELGSLAERMDAITKSTVNIGMQWDQNTGTILNYSEVTHAMLDYYNNAIRNLSGTAQQEALKQYDAYTKLLKNFMSTAKEMTSTQNKIDDIYYKQLENNLKAWEAEIKIKLDLEDAKADWQAFVRKINKDFRLTYQDAKQSMQGMLGQADALLNKININKDAMHDLEGQIDSIRNGGGSDMFASVGEAQGKLNEYLENFKDSAEALYELYQEAWETYLQGIDDIADQFQDIIDKFERIGEVLEHQEKMLELLYGSESAFGYEEQAKIADAEAYNYSELMRSYRQQADFWEMEYNNLSEKNTEDAKKFYDNWQEALMNLYKTEEQYVEALAKKFDSVIKGQFAKIKELMELDWANEQWDLSKVNTDGFYDNTERIYQIQSIANKYQKILNSDAKYSAKIQAQIQEIMEEQVEILKTKDALSERDVAYAEKQLALLEAQIALEDAQNAKNTMKLTRGADGNWSYQYVADEDNLIEKEQAVLDAQNDLYEEAKQGYEDVIETLTQLQIAMIEKIQQKLQEIKPGMSDEQKATIYQQANDIKSTYLDAMEKNRVDYDFFASALGKSEMASLDVFSQYSDMSLFDPAQMDILSYIQSNGGDWTSFMTGAASSWRDFGQQAQIALQQASDASDSTAAKMIETWVGSGDYDAGKMTDVEEDMEGDAPTEETEENEDGENKEKSKGSIQELMIGVFEAITAAEEEFTAAVEAGTEIADDDYMDLDSHIQECIDTTHELQDATSEMVAQATEEIAFYQEVVEMLRQKWEEVKDMVIMEGETAINYLSLQDARAQALAASLWDAVEAAATLKTLLDELGMMTEADTQSFTAGGPSPKTPNGGDGGKTVSGWSNSQDGKVYSSYQESRIGAIAAAGNPLAMFDNGYGYSSGISNQVASNHTTPTAAFASTGTAAYSKALADNRKLYEKYYTFASGGYTGAWNSGSDLNNGRLAFLHQKELVLNEQDTKNILSTVDLIRSMGSSINSSIANSMAQMTMGILETGKLNGISNNNSANTNQTFNIEANFPNADDVSTIQEAILSLPNIVSQYINR